MKCPENLEEPVRKYASINQFIQAEHNGRFPETQVASQMEDEEYFPRKARIRNPRPNYSSLFVDPARDRFLKSDQLDNDLAEMEVTLYEQRRGPDGIWYRITPEIEPSVWINQAWLEV